MDTNSNDNPTARTGDATGTPHLQRSVDGRILGGVAAGLSEYLDIDIAVVRIGFVALGLLGGIAIPLYLAGWLLIPEEGSDSTIADELMDHAAPQLSARRPPRTRRRHVHANERHHPRTRTAAEPEAGQPARPSGGDG